RLEACPGRLAQPRRLDGGGERVPVPLPQHPRRQFERFTVADLHALGGQRLTERARHGLGVAEVAHGYPSFACERTVARQGLALLTRSLREQRTEATLI